MVKLRPIRDVNVRDIEIVPRFNPRKPNKFESFEDIFNQDNIKRIDEFDFTINDFKKIIKRIRAAALRRLDKAVKENDILLDRLDVLDRVLLFAKSFVNVGYKSYGAELGYFEFNRICVDDRQLAALQITTILHELSHFLMKEFTAQILCELLDCRKTSQIESVAVFILSYTSVNQLIDEYCAHTVEGRFTLFGYQDYSSYLSIEKTIDLPAEEIEMIKTIGNSFSSYIKQILESFIDYDMREDIKKQFKMDILDDPDYKNLSMENCQLLRDEGMVQAIMMVIQEGFMISMDNTEILEKYNENWK
jgi:hypothetical protein